MKIDAYPMWAKVLMSRFAKPKGFFIFDPEAYTIILDEELKEWSTVIMLDVMKWMQGQGQDWSATYPTAKMLSIAYKSYLTWMRNAGDAPPIDTTISDRENMIGMCKNKCDRIVARYTGGSSGVPESAWIEIWDWICHCDDNGDHLGSVDVEHHCEVRHGFKRTLTGLGSFLHEAIANMKISANAVRRDK